jgi:major membrane immunogen (membrane-anchored lipoprotein)
LVKRLLTGLILSASLLLVSCGISTAITPTQSATGLSNASSVAYDTWKQDYLTIKYDSEGNEIRAVRPI